MLWQLVIDWFCQSNKLNLKYLISISLAVSSNFLLMYDQTARMSSSSVRVRGTLGSRSFWGLVTVVPCEQPAPITPLADTDFPALLNTHQGQCHTTSPVAAEFVIGHKVYNRVSSWFQLLHGICIILMKYCIILDYSITIKKRAERPCMV